MRHDDDNPATWEFPMPYSELYDKWVGARAYDHRIYGNCPHGVQNAVICLHYALMADHERSLEAIEEMPLEIAA